ncbi:uncharacterized protein AtWU_00130 [Aspergillus tubingensis]|uniref:uncharacterized protein n=1 Tax=Aspergillus tubingensis TaxID=5068 RepID=UPI001578AB92|nr:uncharacterized protein AtWU_00130 [Aspergillus tubingensis]GFN10335.1 hypothetical protein AtWU_00130 [Aspergillus tubingensis]
MIRRAMPLLLENLSQHREFRESKVLVIGDTCSQYHLPEYRVVDPDELKIDLMVQTSDWTMNTLRGKLVNGNPAVFQLCSGNGNPFIMTIAWGNENEFRRDIKVEITTYHRTAQAPHQSDDSRSDVYAAEFDETLPLQYLQSEDQLFARPSFALFSEVTKPHKSPDVIWALAKALEPGHVWDEPHLAILEDNLDRIRLTEQKGKRRPLECWRGALRLPPVEKKSSDSPPLSTTSSKRSRSYWFSALILILS